MQQKLLDELYYNESSSATTYGRKISSEFSLQRMLDGHPEWLQTTALKRKPRKLILADELLVFASPLKKAKITYIFRSLIDKEQTKPPFTIFIWTVDGLRELNDELLNTQDWIDRVIGGKPEDIVAAAAKKSIGKSSLKIIDEYWRDCLCQGEILPERCLYASELITANDTSYSTNSGRFYSLKQRNLQVTNIVFDQYDFSKRQNVDFLWQVFPSAGIESVWQELTLTNEKLVEYLTDDDRSITNANQPQPGDMQALTDITVDYLDFSELDLLAKQSPKLGRLKVKKGFLGSIDSQHRALFPNVEIFELPEGRLFIKHFDILMKLFPNLKQLVISNIAIEADSETPIKLSSIKELESLDMSWAITSPISSKSLAAVLNATPSLKILDLGFFIDEKQLLLDSQALSNLCALNLKGHTRAHHLEYLLAHSKKLKHLNLTKEIDVQGVLHLEPGVLAELETIVLQSEISTAMLSEFLSSCHKLKHIDLSYSLNLQGDIDLKPDSLPYIETIDLSKANISSDNLTKLLKACPNLKTVKFGCFESHLDLFYQTRDRPVLQGNLLLEQHQMAYLDYLDLSGLVASSQSINQLLKSSSSIRTLNLKYNCNLSEEVFNQVKLPQLESVIVSNTNINLHSLLALLRASPNILEIDISSCKCLETDIQYELDCLDKLEGINLSYSKLSGPSFATILRASPHLKSLNIEGCTVTGSFILQPNSLPHLVSFKDSHSLSREAREMLARAAPQLTDELLASEAFDELEDEEHVFSGSLADIVPTSGSMSSHATKKGVEVTPEHDLEKHKRFKPHDETQPFVFDATKQVKNQGMLINKLSQYLTMTNKHKAMIPKLQSGICGPLSFYFRDKGHVEMEAFLDRALAWDGKFSTLSPILARDLTDLYMYVDRYQLNKTTNIEELFLGDNTRDFLSEISVGNTATLTNPWHGVAVEKISETEYCFYDPNGVDGVKTYQLDDLMMAINSQIGHLIGILALEKQVRSIDRLESPKQFVAQGGLLALCRCSNFSPKLFEQLTLLARSMDAESLEGLLLRGTSGRPAWVIGATSADPHIKALTLILLERFKLTHGATANAELSDSMSAMDGMGRLSLAEELATPIDPGPQDFASVEELTSSIKPALKSAAASVLSKELIALCRRTEAQKAYKEELSPWEKSAVTHESILSLKQTLLQPSEETVNRLLRCSSDASVFALTAQLVAQAGQGDIKDEHSAFYIDGPEDLICASPYVERHDKAIKLKKGPGGALYNFLENCKKKNIRPAIIVNYTRLEPEDMVAFNTLLDTHDARADGTPLPNKTRVIGVLNTEHPDVYQGSDFYSRFDEKYDNPFTDEEVQLESVRGFGVAERSILASDKVVIDLYHSADWKSRLLGACVLNGTDMYYEKGELVDALVSGGPIEIHNGPWDDREFSSFWHHLTVGQGVYHAGKWYKMGGTQVVERSDGYNWEALSSHLQVYSGLSRTKQPILNNYTLSSFLGGYTFVEDIQGLIKHIGSIAQHAGQALDVNVTESLSTDTWARILSACKAKGIRLNAHCAPGVRLPTEIAVEPVVMPEIAEFALDKAKDPGFKVVVSKDRETTLRMLKRKQPEVNVISVSGLSPEDLLTHIKTNFDRANASLSVSSECGVLDTELAKEKPVILTGVFTNELAQALTAFALNQEIPPNITLLTEDATEFTHLADFTTQHAVSLTDKLSVLPAEVQTKLPQKIIEAETVNRIEARLKYIAQNPSSDLGDEAWAGMDNLSVRIEIEDAPLDFSSSQLTAEAFLENRKNSVMRCLASSPYCYLTGLTGVGKTTFVEKTFTEKNGYTLFHEAQDIQAWAKSTKPKPVLFLDEANMSEQDWAIFEGLFHEPRRIIIDGVPYPISPEHKLIFAGNPCSYGDERQNNPFFDNYGAAVLCKPLSKAVIYEDILKPVFNDSSFSEVDIQAASQDILAAYTTICRGSPDEILMTPRELQMIALLSLSDAKRSGISLSSTVKGNILAVCASVLENKPYLLQKINLDYATDAVRIPADITQIPPTFHVTPSLEPILSQVQSLIDLRNFRRTHPSINEQQAYGGLGGLVLEGEPGCGKSELLVHALVAAGYEEEHDHGNPTSKENLFYKISASMSLKEKKALLEKAFTEGAVVIMDEINSSPMMEHMLNAMLMGYHPETHARAKPGFMVFGTQNPISMAGRRVASPALRRRMLAINVPEQSKEELCAILASKTSHVDLSIELMVDTYLERRDYALRNNLHPVPCFRDLEKLAIRTPRVSPAATPELIIEPTTAETEPIPKDCYVIQSDKTKNAVEAEKVDDERVKKSSFVSSISGFFKHNSSEDKKLKENSEEASIPNNPTKNNPH